MCIWFHCFYWCMRHFPMSSKHIQLCLLNAPVIALDRDMDINLELSLGAAQWLTTRDSLEDGQTLPTDNKGQLSMKCLDYIIISHKGIDIRNDRSRPCYMKPVELIPDMPLQQSQCGSVGYCWVNPGAAGTLMSNVRLRNMPPNDQGTYGLGVSTPN